MMSLERPAPRSRDPRSLGLQTALAEVLARPLASMDAAGDAFAPFPGEDLRRIAGHPSFLGPVNRAVARVLGFDRIVLDEGFGQRLAVSPASRLAVVLTTRPRLEIESVALGQAAAAALSRRAVGLVLKRDRARLREALGEPGFVLATQEAPLLYPALADLDDLGADLLAAEAETLRDRVLGLGLGVLARFVAAAEPALGVPFGLRSGTTGAAGGLAPAQSGQILKLVTRRMPAWSPLFA